MSSKKWSQTLATNLTPVLCPLDYNRFHIWPIFIVSWVECWVPSNQQTSNCQCIVGHFVCLLCIVAYIAMHSWTLRLLGFKDEGELFENKSNWKFNIVSFSGRMCVTVGSTKQPEIKFISIQWECIWRQVN